MKMFDEIKYYKKEFVYEQYSRIVDDFKDYDRITKTKMLDAIYKVYDNPDNIIDICTIRELKFLKMVLDNKLPEKYSIKNIMNHEKGKYDWEIVILMNKFLLGYERNIPEEIVLKVRQALKKVNWEEKKKIDALNELLVSYCKIHGTSLLHVVCQFASGITGINSKIIWKHMLYNKLFNYYVFITEKKLDSFDEPLPFAIYQDYFEIADELEEQRKKQGLAGVKEVDIRIYKTLFYNDFDINNPKIKKFLDELENLPFFWNGAIELIKEYAMLNIDRGPLKEAIQTVPSLQYIDLTNFFKTLEAAMDEMPSGALNGYTPNEAKEILTKKANLQVNKTKRYVKQENACISSSDAKLFYKIYFGLLEFTNKKYNINKYVKIYGHNGIDPYEIRDIVEKYWENKEKVTNEFCSVNPYKLTQEELNIAKEFKKGIRDIFIIARYELEYTALMNDDKIYMIKGLNDNIDNLIPYTELPDIAMTSIIPFKNNLVYDGMLLGTNIKLGNNFEEMVEKEYTTKMKYYHL